MLRPMRNSATPPRSSPTKIEPIASQTALPVSWCQDAARRDHDADEGRQVLGEDRAQHGVRRDADVAQRMDPSLERAGLRLRQRLQERRSLQHERDREHRIGPAVGRRLAFAVEGLDAVPDRHHGADGEQPEGREHRPDVARPAVAEPVFGIGRLVRLTGADQQEHLVTGVRPGMRRLGEHRRAARDDGGDGLGHRDQGVGTECDDDCQKTLVARTTHPFNTRARQ